ncbi:hypothetical protein HGI47_18780 [Novosphingobium sp. ERN07]|uniref:hypothetical protein n=1 Tax=Novosphingobium sp. ERN07 TaxID=2726187 RepID=UPI001457490C|nr:hypothetical protein [Novosphingobium sp. ERN07]NLR72922.1 hypothetical protein [Novosphingobium sp. ERN07]
MIDDLAGVETRSAAQHGGGGSVLPEIPGRPEIPDLPEIVVRKEWLPTKSASSIEGILLGAIVVTAIGQAVWAVS